MTYTFEQLETIAAAATESGLFAGGQQKLTSAQAFMRILRGIELGLPPTTALSGIWFSNGKMVLDAATIAVLLHRHGYAIEGTVDEQQCTMQLTNASGQAVGQTQFDLAEAKKAGLVRDGSAWTKWTPDMLWARCLTRLARRYAPHVFGGEVYFPQEMEDDEVKFLSPEEENDRHVNASLAARTLIDACVEAMHYRGLTVDEGATYLKKMEARQGASLEEWPLPLLQKMLAAIDEWPTRPLTLVPGARAAGAPEEETV